MDILSIIAISIGLAMDAFGVSIAKGLTIKPKYIFKNAILIAFFFGLFQALMPLLGYYASIHFTIYIITFDHWIAFFLLLGIGLHMIKDANNLDSSNSCLIKYIPFKQLVLLSIATSIDAFVIGVSFAFLQVSIIYACICIGVITLLICFIGVYIGRYIGNSIQSYANYFGGIILILLAVKTLIQHLWIG